MIEVLKTTTTIIYMNLSLVRCVSLVFILLAGCEPNASQQAASEEPASEINVYTHRHYESDQALFAKFETETGIKVNVVNASADELILRMENEGDQSPADVLITVDAGRLERANEKGLLQSVSSEILDTNVPAHLKDEENYWFGLTRRARVIVYDKDRTNPEELSTYEALAGPNWEGRILIRSSGNIYNQSLMASLIANLGEETAKAWAMDVVGNMARDPRGNDRDQMKALVAGEGDVAIVNTYYIGHLLNSNDSSEVNVGNQIGIFFPNQDDRGAHINVSGAGVAAYAPNRENAIRFIEFLTSEEAQQSFSSANYEYPVNPAVAPSALLASWGEFKQDQLPLSRLGEYNKQAVLLFDEVGWK